MASPTCDLLKKVMVVFYCTEQLYVFAGNFTDGPHYEYFHTDRAHKFVFIRPGFSSHKQAIIESANLCLATFLFRA